MATDQRTPKPEWLLVAVGGVSVFASLVFEWRGVFTPAVFVCMFAGLSVLFTKVLSPRPLAVQAIAVAVGLVGIGIGIYWFAHHKNDPDILSPIGFGYLGGGLLLSGILNVAYKRGKTRP